MSRDDNNATKLVDYTIACRDVADVLDKLRASDREWTRFASVRNAIGTALHDALTNAIVQMHALKYLAEHQLEQGENDGT